ncbi:hypothetical protein [Helicobacter sp. 23-1045]
MKYKIYSLCFGAIFACVALPMLALIALLYVYDPLQLFHKPIFRAQTFHGDMRIQARGIVDYVEFDSAIVGSSMLENTSISEAEAKLGGKWVNLSMGGAHPVERAVLLEYLLRAKKPKRILYSLDTHSMVLDKAGGRAIKEQLYGDNFTPKMQFYIDKRFIKCAIKWSKSPECVGHKEMQQIPSAYMQTCAKDAGFLNWCQNERVIKFLRKADEKWQPKAFKGSIKNSQNLINKYILDFVRANPHTEFHLAISAYSTFYYRVRIDDGYVPNPKEHFDKWGQILRWMVNESQKLPNMKIYGFDDLPLTDDVRNYTDQGHYRIGTPLNSIALDAMQNGAHILTPQNVEAYLSAFERKVRNYDIKPLFAELKRWEAQKR